MPELPDLEYLVEKLSPALTDSHVQRFEIINPIIFRTYLEGAIATHVLDRQVRQIFRHGPFVVFAFDRDLRLVVHPMLVGRFDLTKQSPRIGKTSCFVMQFTNGMNLLYRDDRQMGKVYVCRNADLGRIPRFADQGPDILSPEFTADYFRAKISTSRTQVRVFLMEQKTLSAIGNAYADEILFEAGIHPKTLCRQLRAAEVDRLYAAIMAVMRWAIDAVRSAGRPIGEKVRDHLRVRNRRGQPCPRCGTTIRRAGVRGYDTYFCPVCQPSRRANFIDWNAT